MRAHLMTATAFWLCCLPLAACDRGPPPCSKGCEELALPAHDVPALAADDRLFWARTLYGEARDQDPRELEAISHVILNRWHSGRYGSTVVDVVLFSRNGSFAFSCWNPASGPFKGMMAAGTDKLRPYLEIVDKVWFERNGYGKGTDITAGATHYYHPAAMRPAGSVPVWARPAILRRAGGEKLAMARLAAGEDLSAVLPPPWTHRVQIGDAVFMTLR